MPGDQPRHVGAPPAAAERLAGQDEERPRPLAAQAVQPGQDRAAGQSRQGRRPELRHSRARAPGAPARPLLQQSVQSVRNKLDC